MKKIDKVYIKKLAPFIVLFVCIYFLHLSTKVYSDDLVFKEVNLNSGFEYLINRYNTWSSRLLIELTNIIILKLPVIVWTLLDSFAFTCIAYSLSRLFNAKKDFKLDCFICLITFAFPYTIFGSAGWITTTTNYNWGLAAGLIALSPLRDIAEKKKFNKWWMFLYIPCMFYATDVEQFACVAFAILALWIIYYKFIKKEKINPYIYVLFGIVVAKIIFIILCPGNTLRTQSEIEKWLPSYEYLNIFQKAYIGTLYTARAIFNQPIIIILTSSILVLLTYLNKEKIYNKVIANIYFISTLVFIIGMKIPKLSYYKFAEFLGLLNKDLKTVDFEMNWLMVLLLVLQVCMLLYLLYVNLKNVRWRMILLVLIGIGSQMMMMMSPTIYASGLRTGTFMYIIFIILNIVMAKEIFKKDNKLAGEILTTVILTLDTLNFINMITWQITKVIL